MGFIADALAQASNLAEIAGRRPRAEVPSEETLSSNPAQWFRDWLDGGRTYAGPPVSELSAVRATTVFRCISIIANTLASLPFNVYERTDEGRQRAPQHPLQKILHDQPNRLTSSFTMRQIISGGLLTNGNGYAVIGRTQDRRVLDLMQVAAQDVQVDKIGAFGSYRLQYTVSIDGQQFSVPQEDMIHVPGFGFDGVSGISVIAAVGKQSIGLGLALEEFQGRFTEASARGSGIVEVDKALSDKGLQKLREAFDNLYSGRDKAGRTVFLDKGQTWKSMQVDPADAQVLESRKYQVEDIARIYGVPPHMLGATDKATSWGTGIEQQTIAFVEYVIRPWVVSIEQEFNRKLFRGRYFCELGLQGLLRGDSKARAEFYRSGINNAWLKPNEARGLENLPPDDGGDRLFINTALQPIDRIDDRLDAQLSSENDNGNNGRPALPPPAPEQRDPEKEER